MNNNDTAPDPRDLARRSDAARLAALDTPAPVVAFRAEHDGHGRISVTPTMVVCHECHVWAPVPAVGGPMTCPRHPAYHADYCPVCGTAVVIGGTR